MIKRVVALILAGILCMPIVVDAEDEIDSDTAQVQMQLIRTTVYDGPSDHTATGRKAEYGIVAFDPAYYGKTCILYTEDMRYIGIFECEDTGGHRVRTGQVLDVYCPTRKECYEWVAENGMYCYVQWIESEG